MEDTVTPLPTALTPFVVHCKRAPFDVLIDRSTRWGNPYRIGRDGTREEVIAKYRADERFRTARFVAMVKSELRGKILGCWCAPLPCHGDVLAEIANA